MPFTIFDGSRVLAGFLFPTLGWGAVTTAFIYEITTLQGKDLVKHLTLYFFGFCIRVVILDATE